MIIQAHQDLLNKNGVLVRGNATHNPGVDDVAQKVFDATSQLLSDFYFTRRGVIVPANTVRVITQAESEVVHPPFRKDKPYMFDVFDVTSLGSETEYVFDDNGGVTGQKVTPKGPQRRYASIDVVCLGKVHDRRHLSDGFYASLLLDGSTEDFGIVFRVPPPHKFRGENEANNFIKYVRNLTGRDGFIEHINYQEKATKR